MSVLLIISDIANLGVDEHYEQKPVNPMTQTTQHCFYEAELRPPQQLAAIGPILLIRNSVLPGVKTTSDG